MRDNESSFTFKMPEKVKLKFKIIVAKKKLIMKDVLTDLIEKYLKSNESK